MGNTRWDPSDWHDHSAKASTQSRAQIFTSHGLDPDLDPRNIKVRESVDSPANPESTPIMLFVDQTGSMGFLAENIIKTGLGVIVKEVYDRKPVTDPHVLVGAIGDGKNMERAPLQASQFEAGVDPIVEQVKKIFLEGNGGGNGGESYVYAWYFAATRTSCDAITKRGKKGFLFTVGDEEPHLVLTRDEIKTYFGDDVERDYTAQELLDMIRPHWEVFHLNVHVGYDSTVKWKQLLGERCMPVDDHEKLAEVIVSTLEVLAGKSVADVAGSWSGSTAVTVQNAVKGLATTSDTQGDALVRL